MKSKSLFWIFFIILICINTYIYGAIYNLVLDFVAPNITFDLMIILLYLLSVVPFTLFFSEKITEYSLSKGLEKTKYFTIFLALVIVLPISLFSVIKVNDYKEKGLDDVLSYNTKTFTSLAINEWSDELKWRTDNQDHVDELYTFLSQYRIKKMKAREWDSDVPGKGFHVSIYTKGVPIMASLEENRLHFFNEHSYYKVINGPIDMKWVEKFQEKYE